LELALATGEVIRTGGRVVKASSGYDLTQLVIGSEGTLALVTEATLKLVPRPAFSATVLAPFPTLDEVASSVPKVIASGLAPSILEYIDMLTMAAIQREYAVELGVPADVQATALAYLVVRMESDHDDRLDEDVQAIAELLVKLGAVDVYVLPPAAAAQLIEAREKAFWLAKANGADDIVDIVVPRARIADFMTHVGQLASERGAFVAGCGHAGDGNVHLSVFQPDPEVRSHVLRDMFAFGLSLGGAISGEHGIGTTKKKYFLELEDPTKIELMRAIKAAFDPHDILNPGTIF
jgi:glycolate oxidase